jgi:Ca2+-binding EF-hand superfamily protein
LDLKSLKEFGKFTSHEVKNLMRRLDLNGNRKITLSELTEALTPSVSLNHDLLEETK